MTYVGEEERLGAIDFRQCLRALIRFFIGARVSQSRHDLPDIQTYKGAIASSGAR